MYYRQAHSRGRPSVIEANLQLPANSTTRIELDVDKAYLWYTDYPPDALRGFDVPSGVLLANVSGVPRRMYTTATLLDMPTPDFSMPYNVIIMTCRRGLPSHLESMLTGVEGTVMALFFGSVFNLLTRTWLIIDMHEPSDKDKAEPQAERKPGETSEGRILETASDRSP